MREQSTRRGAIRAFRTEDVAALAEARAAAFDGFGDPAGRGAHALRAERRNRGGKAYDLLRHLGLVRRRKRQAPA
ncbi:hypothetical protein [Blastochloris sulfoviridis]|uniref:Uncharacterized protein n=1 Tax=Blastochloris sulfoviridis TaxID=50712 RepID=A0A5M6I3T4_9HYPH|nr:hypothetical protein [Blastochloris sulfoviridis]KAA5602871.1 hypothetical protein F1193_03265 [Blastochloris sulfoviridis]